MSRHWRWFLPAYVLLAPFALAYVAFLYIARAQPTAWRWHEGVLTCVSKRGALPFGAGGQGWSWIVAFADESQRESASLRVHEFVHVGQEFVCCAVGLTPMSVLVLLGEWKIGVMLALAGAALFHVVYGATWLYSLLTGRGVGFQLWPGERVPRWWRAYRSIPWESHAYDVQDEHAHGLHGRAWGSRMLQYRR